MKKRLDFLVGLIGLLFIISLVLSMILSFGFPDMYKPLAPFFSNIVKYSFISAALLAILSALTDKKIPTVPKKEDKKVQEKNSSSPEKQIIYVEKQANDNKAGLLHGGVHCPYCRSLDIQFMQNKKKGFSVGKAVGGAALTGGIGTLAGFAGKKGKKNEWRCNSCGRTFKSKR